MKSAALELGRYGITMNAVIPGLIDTSLTRHEDRYAQAISAAGKEPSGHREADEATAADLLATGSPLGVPWIEPADVAPVVAFLASDQARMVSPLPPSTGGDVPSPRYPAGQPTATMLPPKSCQICPIGWRFSDWNTSSVRPDAQ